MNWLTALPVIGEVFKFLNWAGSNSLYGLKYLFWTISLSKLKKKKEDIQDASSPGDFTDISN